MALRIALAGRVELEADGVPVDAGRLGSLGRLALAYLVAHRHRPVPRDELADVLWDDDLPKSWETSVRVVVSKVRAVLAEAGLAPSEVLSAEMGCYRLRLPPDTVVDVEEAAAAVDRARTAMAGPRPETDVPAAPMDAARQAASLAAAIAARRFLPGMSGSWVDRRQAELADLRLRALELESDAAAGQGDWDAATAAAEAAVALDPFRESAHLRLLTAHAGAGNRAGALRAYERARRLLAEELGMDPSAPLQAAYVALLGYEPARAGEPAPPPPAGGVPPSLPSPLTSFVGRADAIAEVQRLLASTRMLSLTGAGGMGKTRLALRIAAEEAARDPLAVALVELGPLSDPGLVPQQVLSALGLGEQPGRSPLETVTDHLRTRPVLLVVDNCEHVLEASAEVAGALLRSCPDLRILATTREPLKVAGETVWRVPTLSVPAPMPATGGDGGPTMEGLGHYEAVRLFLDRAYATRPDLELTDEDAPALAALVRRLDGIPLALELAAGRVGVLSVGELAERLDDRFRLLSGGSRTSPERHQTLRAAVDWTYDALSPGEAMLFARLSVFASAFSLDAAEDVCAGDGIARHDVLGLLSSLVDKSLVAAEHARAATRYRLLETMRRYGQERLAEDRAAESARRDAHLSWAVALAGQAEPALRGPDQRRWLEVLEAALDDLRAALAWGVANPGTQGAVGALGMAAAMERFWEVRGYLSEGRGWLEALLVAGGGAGPPVRAQALGSAAILAQRQGDYGPARELHAESLRLAREAGDDRGVAAAVHGLGNLAVLQGDFAAARPLYEQVLAIGRHRGDDNVVAAALTNLGTVAHNQASFDEARVFSEESLEVRRRMGDRHGIAMVTGNLAYLAFQQGDHVSARDLYGQSLDLQRELGDRPGIANSLANLGYLALAEGDLAGASSLLEESLALADQLGDKYWTALSLLRLAKVARAEGDHARASTLDARALTLASAMGAKRAMAEWLEGLARTAVAQDAFRRAMVLLGAAQAVRDELGAPLPPAEQPGRDADLAAARAALGTGADAAWDEGRAVPLDDAVRLASSD